MKKIEITPEVKAKILHEFSVSERTIWNAINYKTGGYAANQIRRRALELGGREWATTDEKEGGEE